MAKAVACKVCIMAEGLSWKSAHLFHGPNMDEDFFNHMKVHHNINLGDFWTEEIALIVERPTSESFPVGGVAARFEGPPSKRIDRWTSGVEWAIANKRQDILNVLSVIGVFLVRGAGAVAFMHHVMTTAPHDVRHYWLEEPCDCKGAMN